MRLTPRIYQVVCLSCQWIHLSLEENLLQILFSENLFKIFFFLNFVPKLEEKRFCIEITWLLLISNVSKSYSLLLRLWKA